MDLHHFHFFLQGHFFLGGMPVPIKVTCAGCGASLTAPDTSAGLQATCPKCDAVIQVPIAQAEDEIVEAEATPFDGPAGEEASSDVVEQNERKPCPACGEMIIRDAVKCRFCGEIFDPALKEQERKQLKKQTMATEGAEMSTGDWVVAILCSGIGCIAGIVWMIQGKPKGKKMLLVSLSVQFFWFIVQVILTAASQIQ